MTYQLRLETLEGDTLATRDVGTWRDNAVEQWKGARDRIGLTGRKGYVLSLVDTSNDSTIAEVTE